MYKITWGRKSDKFHKTFIIIPDCYALFETYSIISSYGKNDGYSPIDIKVTNLDGQTLDMSKGIGEIASIGTYSSRDV